MRAPAALLAFTLLAVPALGATPSVVSIAPVVGTVSGGDIVTIVVDTPLHSCAICAIPAFAAEVTFDGTPATIVSAFDKIIAVRTPAHTHGTVDVVVTSEGAPYGTAKFTYAGWYGPIDISNYEKILVPFTLPAGRTLPGAFGSQWTTEFWVSNEANAPAELFNDVICTLSCPLFLVAEPPYPQIASKSTTKIDPPDAGGNVAFLYYLQKSYSNDVHFSLHAADVSRSKENAGTEIGVVRERDFRLLAFDILNVPIDAGSRAALRLYDPTAFEASFAHVSIYSMTNGALLASSDVPLPLPVKKSASKLADVVPTFAGFGQIGDLRSTFNLPDGRVRIQIELRGTSRGWGFVSVTNNVTQLITTYRPE